MRTPARTGKTLALVAVGLVAMLAVRRRRRAQLRRRTVVVTGGSRGLGLSIARRFARLGAHVAICARDEAELARATERLAAEGLAVSSWRCDLTDAELVRHTITAIEATVGPIEVLVNNAGILHVGPAQAMSTEDLRASLDLHLWGTVNATEAVLPGMRARRRGRIVNIASIGGLVAVPWLLPYSVSKAALVAYSTAMRYELARDGIAVTTIAPWFMRTGGPINGIFKGTLRGAALTTFALLDSLPLVTMDPDRVAKTIVRATLRKRALVVVGWPARLLTLLHALAPNGVTWLLTSIARLLPRSTTSAGGVGRELAANLGRSAHAVVERSAAKHNQPTPEPIQRSGAQ